MTRAAAWALAATALAAGCAGDRLQPAPATFVASDADFANFPDWYMKALPNDPTSDIIYPAGARFGYLNRQPPAHSTSYPVGTVLVKAIKNDDVPENWELFGMAKRGGDYDADGAVGWEYFLLRYDPSTQQPHIYSRGVMPTDDGRADMFVNEGAYGAGGPIRCDICHGLAQYKATDGMIGALMTPQATALLQ